MKDKIARVHEGMDVQTSDGISLGTITCIWWGSIPEQQFSILDDETCFEIQRCNTPDGSTLYVPCSAIADVASDCVTLTMDAETVYTKPWNQKPKWLPDDLEIRPATSYREASA
jgi:hypothetical protein